MHKIALCVCTYNRPLGLRALLEGIERQRLVHLADAQVHVVVVDNSLEGSAARSSDLAGLQRRFPLSLVHEPRKGLSMARNRALAAAHQVAASHVAFIDDDELPHPAWLESLHATLVRSGAAAAIGPVFPVFARQPPRWLPPLAYADLRSPSQGFVDDGYTCNVMCALAAIEANGLAFDDRFNATGGEDTYFFKQLREKGLRIAWAEQAVVFSLIPEHRMTVRWLWQRWYRTGDIEAHLGRLRPSTAAGRLINLLRGLARIAVGSVRIIGAAAFKGWRQPDAVVASFYTACRGAGLIANVVGHRYREYGRTGYR